MIADWMQATRGCRAELKAFLALLLLASAPGIVAPASAANVAVILSDKVDDYQEALRGFKEAARHTVFTEHNMAGDVDRGRKILTELETKSKPDLIFAVGIWALHAVVSQPTNVPVVYAMVLTDVTGTWKGWATLTLEGDPNMRPRMPITLVLEQKGPKVVGRVSSWAGAVIQLEGAVAGETLTFSTTIDGELTVEGDEMAGVVRRAEIQGSIAHVNCPCKFELRRERSQAPALPSR